MKVENMTSSRGNTVPNQFIIQTEEGLYFQSYKTVIAFKLLSGKVQLDSDKWDYSLTTAKYRNMFLDETTKETRHKIKKGEYELVNLNK
jgi:hypothetical protein